jgi:hypothetical protein
MILFPRPRGARITAAPRIWLLSCQRHEPLTDLGAFLVSTTADCRLSRAGRSLLQLKRQHERWIRPGTLHDRLTRCIVDYDQLTSDREIVVRSGPAGRYATHHDPRAICTLRRGAYSMLTRPIFAQMEARSSAPGTIGVCPDPRRFRSDYGAAVSLFDVPVAARIPLAKELAVSNDMPRATPLQEHDPPSLPWEGSIPLDRAELEVLASVSRRLDRARRWLEDLDTLPNAAPLAEDTPSANGS